MKHIIESSVQSHIFFTAVSNLQIDYADEAVLREANNFACYMIAQYFAIHDYFITEEYMVLPAFKNFSKKL